jgi:hypothetical protein
MRARVAQTHQHSLRDVGGRPISLPNLPNTYAMREGGPRIASSSPRRNAPASPEAVVDGRPWWLGASSPVQAGEVGELFPPSPGSRQPRVSPGKTLGGRLPGLDSPTRYHHRPRRGRRLRGTRDCRAAARRCGRRSPVNQSIERPGSGRACRALGDARVPPSSSARVCTLIFAQAQETHWHPIRLLRQQSDQVAVSGAVGDDAGAYRHRQSTKCGEHLYREFDPSDIDHCADPSGIR